MTLTQSDIKPGSAYIKDDGMMIRLVDSISNGRIYYRSFWIGTGEYDTSGDCDVFSLLKFIGATGREATPEEISRLDIKTAREEEMKKRTAIVMYHLSEATDEQLRAEVGRRGWKLE